MRGATKTFNSVRQQSASAPRKGNNVDLIQCRPRPPGGMPLTLGGSFSPANSLYHACWAKERAQRLHRVFLGAERRIARDQTLHQALKYFLWWLWSEPRFYRCDRDRPFRLSRVRVVQLFRDWRKGGRRPEALALRYWAPVKLRPTAVADFGRLCITSGVKSFAEAYGRLPRMAATWSGYYYALPLPVRRRIIRLFAARRLALGREAKARAAVNDFTRGIRPRI